MGNWTLPVNATSVIDWMHWTNQVTSTYGITIFALFFTFLLPFILLVNAGQDKIDAMTVSALVASVLMFILSLQGLIASEIVISMFFLTGIGVIVNMIKSR